MDVRHDLTDSPTASAAPDHRDGGDPEQLLLEQRHSAPRGALTETPPPPADVPWHAARTADADRSWLWRWRSLKASLQKTYFRRAHGEPVTMEAMRSLEEHLTSLTKLHELCARIDQRLARTEAVSGRTDGATMDTALRDVCAEIYDRLIRVEAAIQRTEGFVADKPWDLSAIAYKRLERVEEAMWLTQKSIEDSTLPDRKSVV